MKKVKFISHNDYRKFEKEINEFIKDKELIDLRYNVNESIIEGEPYYYYNVLIIYNKI